jgi:hypothetical protein
LPIIGKGYPYPREVDFILEKMKYFEIVKKDIFLLKLYLIKHDSADVMNIGWIIPSMTNTNSSSSEVLIQ